MSNAGCRSSWCLCVNPREYEDLAALLQTPFLTPFVELEPAQHHPFPSACQPFSGRRLCWRQKASIELICSLVCPKNPGGKVVLMPPPENELLYYWWQMPSITFCVHFLTSSFFVLLKIVPLRSDSAASVCDSATWIMKPQETHFQSEGKSFPALCFPHADTLESYGLQLHLNRLTSDLSPDQWETPQHPDDSL